MDRKEFERIAPGLRRRIVDLVKNIVSDNCANQADDVAQDTLLRLWSIRERLDSYASVDALAVVIARNMAIDLVRKDHKAVPIEEVGSIPLPMPVTPHDVVAGMEAEQLMDSIMGSLSAGQRALMRMRHEDGMEMSEIAAALGSTEGAVRVALSRTRRHIMNLFKMKVNE